jgi:hypothetical protein
MERFAKIAADHRRQAEIVRDQSNVMIVVSLFG